MVDTGCKGPKSPIFIVMVLMGDPLSTLATDLMVRRTAHGKHRLAITQTNVLKNCLLVLT